MKVDEKDISQVKKQLKVHFDWDEISDQYNNILSEAQENFRMDGFRPGKVPMEIVKNKLGEKIKYQFLNEIFREKNEDVLDEIGLDRDELLDFSVEEVDFEEEEHLEYTLQVEKDPEIELIDYKEGFSLDKTNYVVDEEDVDLYIEEMKERSAQAKTVEDGAEIGHYISADLQQMDDGVPVVGNKFEDKTIELGEEPFTEPGISNLLGAQAGDEREISLETEDGQEIEYKVDVKGVEEHILPEIDDEWVEENLDSVSDLDEWRDQIEDMLKEKWEDHAEQEFANKIKEYFLNNMDFEIPESRVDYYLEQIIKDAKQRSEKSEEEIDEESIKRERRGEAEKSVKWHLIKEKIIEEEGIEPKEEEIEEKLEEMVQQYPEEQRGQFKQYYKNNDQARRSLELQVEEEKVLDHIKEYIDINEESINTSEAREQARQAR